MQINLKYETKDLFGGEWFSKKTLCNIIKFFQYLSEKWNAE